MLTVIITTAVGLFVTFALFLYFGQGKLIFVPSRSIDTTPDQIGLDYEDVYIEVARGERINAWYFPADNQSDRAPTVLFCHGNAGNISHRLQTMRLLVDLGVNVLLFDYRGYGLSDGSPSEDNVYADASAAYRWLLDGKNCQPTELYLFGRSLGGAVTIDLAGKVDCAGLIVESSFTSAADMGRRLYPFMPIKLLARHELDAVSKIEHLTCPLLVGHSPDDDIIPYDMGQTLFERARSEKQFIVLEGRHNDLLYLDNSKYINTLRQFFEIGKEGPSAIVPEGESGSGQID